MFVFCCGRGVMFLEDCPKERKSLCPHLLRPRVPLPTSSVCACVCVCVCVRACVRVCVCVCVCAPKQAV